MPSLILFLGEQWEKRPLVCLGYIGDYIHYPGVYGLFEFIWRYTDWAYPRHPVAMLQSAPEREDGCETSWDGLQGFIHVSSKGVIVCLGYEFSWWFQTFVVVFPISWGKDPVWRAWFLRLVGKHQLERTCFFFFWSLDTVYKVMVNHHFSPPFGIIWFLFFPATWKPNLRIWSICEFSMVAELRIGMCLMCPMRSSVVDEHVSNCPCTDWSYQYTGILTLNPNLPKTYIATEHTIYIQTPVEEVWMNP